MDSFAESNDLFGIQQALYSGDYTQVIAQDIDSLNQESRLKAEFYRSLAEIKLGKTTEVIAKLQGRNEPAIIATRHYAAYKGGKKAESIKGLVHQSKESTDGVVLYLAGLVLATEGDYAEALEIVSRHEGSLECVSLMTQIYLIQNRLDLAEKLVKETKSWAQDSIVFNLAESWVKLRQNGDDAQNAFYIYEEMNPPSVKSFVGQAVCQLELGRIPEADELLNEALQLDSNSPEALANAITLAVLSDKEYSDYETKLRQVKRDHPLLTDLKEKSDLFDQVVAKYQEV